MKSENIFLSYRRSDGLDKARLLKIFLERIGYTVFMDINIEKYTTFPEQLVDKIEGCKDFILVLTRDACQYRSSQDEDYMYQELKLAYDRNMRNKSSTGGEGSVLKVAPRLHIVSNDNTLINEFKKTEGLPSEYVPAVEYFGALTPLNDCLNFELPDSAIESKLKNNDYLDLLSAPTGDPEYSDTQDVIESGQDPFNPVNEEMVANQVLLESEKDMEALGTILKLLKKKTKKTVFTVLDVGCAKGEAGQKLFGSNDFSMVVGIDKNEENIQECRGKYLPGGKFLYRIIDINDKDLDGKLKDIESEKGISSFDIIYCSQVLHHYKPHESILNKLYKHLSPGGCFIIKGSDDGCKISYLKSKKGKRDFILPVMEKTKEVRSDHMADRYYGRKIYYDLEKLNLSDIHIIPQILCSTDRRKGEERDAYMDTIFRTCFQWRVGVFQDEIKKNPARKEELEERIKEMNVLLDDLQDDLKSGWYFGVDFIGYGFKRNKTN